jgi:hypothetical protein
MIHESESVKQFITKHNIIHFGQAHGTPFTVPPLNTIARSADDAMSEEMIKGHVPAAFSSQEPMVDKVLEGIAQAKQLPEIDTYISTEDMAKGSSVGKKIHQHPHRDVTWDYDEYRHHQSITKILIN